MSTQNAHITLPQESELLVEIINKHNLLVGEMSDVEEAVSRFGSKLKEISDSLLEASDRLDNLSKSIQPLFEREYLRKKCGKKKK